MYQRRCRIDHVIEEVNDEVKRIIYTLASSHVHTSLDLIESELSKVNANTISTHCILDSTRGSRVFSYDPSCCRSQTFDTKSQRYYMGICHRKPNSDT